MKRGKKLTKGGRRKRNTSAFGALGEILEGIESRQAPRKRASSPAAPPRTEQERQIADIFAALLKVVEVGIHDSFFELGGSSLLAVQVISRLRKAFGADVSLRDLFEGPTVAELAAAVDRTTTGSSDDHSAMTISRVDRDGPLPASYTQQGFWFLERLQTVSSWQPTKVIQLDGELDLAALRWAFGEVLRRHEVLRTTYEQRGPDLVQVVHDEGEELWSTDLSGLPGDVAGKEQMRLLGAVQSRPFEFDRRPPVRAMVIRAAARRYVVCFVIHHIASDLWSTAIFERDLLSLLSARIRGASSPLPALPIQYGDFASWQRGWLTGAELDRHLDFWRRQLTDVRALRLPVDRPPSKRTSFTFDWVDIEISAGLTAGLQSLSRRVGSTLFMTLLAAYYTLLWRYTGQADICVSTNVAGRDRQELESLIGPFTNLLVLRTDLSDDPTFLELLGRVRDVCVGAWDHHALPFGMLWDRLSPAHGSELSHVLRNQTVLALQNVPVEEAASDLGAVQVSPWEAPGSSQGGADRRRNSDLEVFLSLDKDRLAGSLLYSMDLFDPGTAEWMVRHYVRLLELVAEDADRPISALLVCSAEMNQAGEWLFYKELPPDPDREDTATSAKKKRKTLKLLLARHARKKALSGTADDE